MNDYSRERYACGFLSFAVRERGFIINTIKARIVSVHKERYGLLADEYSGYGRLKSSVYLSTDSSEPYPTVGDYVLIEPNEKGDSRIIKTLERRTFFSRRDPTPGRGEQAIAANFDYVFIMQSLNKDFNTKRLERYIAAAWQSGAVPVIILTKADLAGDPSEQMRMAGRIAPGAGVFAVSALTGQGLELIADYLKPGKTLVLLGSSGVGKSSLVNALKGEDVMAVKIIREDDSKGRHTTTHRELITLPSGAFIIDTPGMREFGIWCADGGEGFSLVFGDVEQYTGRCRYSDCRHESEPDCAVKAALESGELPRERWESYLNLKQDISYSEDKAEYLRLKSARNKEIAMFSKQLKKDKRKK